MLIAHLHYYRTLHHNKHTYINISHHIASEMIYILPKITWLGLICISRRARLRKLTGTCPLLHVQPAWSPRPCDRPGRRAYSVRKAAEEVKVSYWQTNECWFQPGLSTIKSSTNEFQNEAFTCKQTSLLVGLIIVHNFSKVTWSCKKHREWWYYITRGVIKYSQSKCNWHEPHCDALCQCCY